MCSDKAKLRHSSQRGSEGRSRRQSTAPADLFPFRNVFLPRIWTGWSTSGLCWYLLRTLSGSECESLIELSQDQHPGSELQWARVLFLFLTWLPFRNKNPHILACSWNSWAWPQTPRHTARPQLDSVLDSALRQRPLASSWIFRARAPWCSSSRIPRSSVENSWGSSRLLFWFWPNNFTGGDLCKIKLNLNDRTLTLVLTVCHNWNKGCYPTLSGTSCGTLPAFLTFTLLFLLFVKGLTNAEVGIKKLVSDALLLY